MLLRPKTVFCLLLALSWLAGKTVTAELDEAAKQLAHDLFKQLIEINTTDSVGNVTTAAEALAQRFREAGFPDRDIQVIGPNQRKKNMVVRLHGSGKHKPVLLIGHLDVVEALREDWTTDPFQFVEKDGYFYGRGTQDMKDGDAIMATTLIQYKKEGFVPNRDIILALTADEEGGDFNGVNWLIQNHRDLIDAEFVLNPDGGGILSLHGKPLMMRVDATEKLYADYTLTVRNPGGHSSLPLPDNAIYELAHGLTRLEHSRFPLELNGVTRAYYAGVANIENPERARDMKAILSDPANEEAVARLSEDPIDNALLHTTCVATRLNAGHANNALPQTAVATVNCRIEPGHTPEEIRKQLESVVSDARISVAYIRTDGAAERKAFPPAPLRPELFVALRKIVARIWPGLPVIPAMGTGASDAVYTNAAGMAT
ncbi:MAG: M20/M25/M40 family metallo-hydrolase, partial [Acidobacteria bacterium]|nr:M20/M25/M40 family metallo-hydrolase [Acidobacteriota bacterium]